MQVNGVNLGDNQIKLLQKVEELTLYLIEKDKQLNDEEKMNYEQEVKINAQTEANRQLWEQLKSEADKLISQQQQIDQLRRQLELIIKNRVWKNIARIITLNAETWEVHP